MSHRFELTPAERGRLEQVAGIVFDVQRYSVHDGPGLRTSVFLKGCPLRCAWCANPESQQPQPELALFEQNCITCGQFESPCAACWPQPASADFAQRALVCPTGALRWLGERRTAGEVMAEVRRDVPFYGAGGGLTLTGGEATMQPELAEALLRLAKAEGISTAIETCGHTRWSVWERLLPYLDDILYDVKHVDSALHQQYTGLGNELILANLRQLAAVGAPLTIRVPLVPGFNADDASVRAIAGFVAGLPGAIKAVNVLPYHTLGRAKYAALGRDYPWAGHARPTDAEVATLAGLFAGCGLPVSTGG
ncbi:MAG: Choline trimethylamine-lyase activating enzyme [Anaerolineae bacterium]|nr:Choline trimethylamine-lyase activating enzyme [Anaerolineae bacterium]